MIKATNLKIALSHLTSRVKQGLVATLSVTFGISMYIFMNSFMTGVNDIQEEMAFSTLAHIHIYNDLPEDHSNLLEDRYEGTATLVNLRNARIIQYTEGIRNADKIVNTIKQLPEVAEVSVEVSTNVFFRNGSTKVNGLLAGIHAATDDRMFGTSESMKLGNWHDLDNRGDGIILGVGLAKKLGLKMGDNVVVSTADGVTRTFNIIGILETTLTSIDNSKAYIRVNSARQLLSQNRSYATDIQVNINDFEQSRAVAQKLAALTSYKVDAWNDANGQLEAGNDLRNYIAIAVSLTILLVAGFGIYNIMNMTVNEKIKEIAILKAMGFEGGDIVEIFLVQSLIIGLLGGLIGILLGFTVAITVNQIPFNVGTLANLPMAYRTIDYVSAFGFGLLTTFIAGYLPAKKASQVDPVAIIRG